jgi:hypothetical protein
VVKALNVMPVFMVCLKRLAVLSLKAYYGRCDRRRAFCPCGTTYAVDVWLLWAPYGDRAPRAFLLLTHRWQGSLPLCVLSTLVYRHSLLAYARMNPLSLSGLRDISMVGIRGMKWTIYRIQDGVRTLDQQMDHGSS